MNKIFLLLGIVSLFFIIYPGTGSLFFLQRYQGNTKLTSIPYMKKRLAAVGADRTFRQIQRAKHLLGPGQYHASLHVFGQLLYQQFGQDALKMCDMASAYGCFHGFLAEAIRKEGISVAKRLGQICSSFSEAKNVACLHGIGHGLAEYNSQQPLLASLSVCDTVDELPIAGCKGGVFMEYNFRTTQDPQSSGKFWRTFYPKDPYEPCASMPQRYRRACWLYQSEWWVEILSKDYKKAANLCASVGNGTERLDCYNGIALTIAFDMNNNTTKIQSICEHMNTEEEKNLCLHPNQL